jgi:hypothetical protein
VTTASFRGRALRVFGAGLLGVIALPIFIIPQIAASDAVAQTGLSANALLALSLVQPVVLLAIAAAIGAAIAPRIGALSYVAEAKGGLLSHLLAVGPTALITGAILGLIVVAADTLVFRSLLPDFFAAVDAFQQPLALRLVFGVLYGGITEEVLLRWGLLSLLAWAFWRTLARGETAPPPAAWWTAIVLAAVIFGAGHLPAASTLAPLDAVQVIRIVLLNALAGAAYGWLYWRYSLEAAMLAHAATHLAFVLLALAGLGV